MLHLSFRFKSNHASKTENISKCQADTEIENTTNRQEKKILKEWKKEFSWSDFDQEMGLLTCKCCEISKIFSMTRSGQSELVKDQNPVKNYF